MDAFGWGLVGAAVGLIIGIVEYRVLVGVIVDRLRATEAGKPAHERALFEAKLATFRKLFFAASVLAYPVVGYFLGRTFGG